MDDSDQLSLLDRVIRFCLDNRLIVVLAVLLIVAWGVMVAPFDWDLWGLPRDPVPVDAIPDIGENLQIVFTEWTGRSPQDVEDQITYPMTVSLLGIPGVETIRSFSMFGFSTISVIFQEDVDFYWSRSRILEKLASLPAGTLPEGVQPALGPDATALGQVFWYTLEGHDPDGRPIGGWDLYELRTVQDWYVRYALLSAEGISEVASIGGFVQEYQIDVDPDAMRAHRVGLDDVFQAVRMSNLDVGARTVEVNRVEYIIRGLGFLQGIRDLENSVVTVNDNVPIRLRDLGKVTLGPALRRGVLDKAGAEAVGGIVTVRYGYNPLAAIEHVKAQIEEFAPGLPRKAVIEYRRVTRKEVENFAAEHGFEAFGDPDFPELLAKKAVPTDQAQANDEDSENPEPEPQRAETPSPELNHSAWLDWLTRTPRDQWPDWINISQVTVVPFYDRTGLIHETLGTLGTALSEQILITIIVVIVLVTHLRSSLLISAVLPLAVLMAFIAMKQAGVDANIVALSGIAIAIGTMIDLGVIVAENILKRLEEAGPEDNRRDVVFHATGEVSGAVVTAVITTIISFLPVFAMMGSEGKLFRPLAFTKVFALGGAVIVALAVIPPMAYTLFTGRIDSRQVRRLLLVGLLVAGAILGFTVAWWAGLILVALAAYRLGVETRPVRAYAERTAWLSPTALDRFGTFLAIAAAVALVGVLLTSQWLPLGGEVGMSRNLIFVGGMIAVLLGFFQLFRHVIYVPILRGALACKKLFLTLPTAMVLAGVMIWLGFEGVFGFIPPAGGMLGLDPDRIRETRPWTALRDTFPGLGREFMPALDEGSFLLMPSTMPHASIGEVMEVMTYQNRRLAQIPEIELVVGKLGRAESPLDPAPLSMIETIIQYKTQYVTDVAGRQLRFRYDAEREEFVRDEDGHLIEDPLGRPFRQWRDHIRSADDIWQEITRVAAIPGTTDAPKLQPIETRLVMLQTGMRAPMGVVARAPDLETLENVALQIERFLKEVPGVRAEAVLADRVIGKPFLEIDIDREAIARYGLMIKDVQNVIEVGIGGRTVTTTVEGRERFPVRVRYLRELRDEIETLGRVLVPTPDGSQIPLEQLAEIRYLRGPQVIKSEDTFLVAYIIFDRHPDFAPIDVVEACRQYLDDRIAAGEFVLPTGVSYRFAGDFEQQLRAVRTLAVVVPLALFLIFMVLYLKFRSAVTSALVFSDVAVAWAGGFLMIWLYGQPWFFNFAVFGVNLRDLFGMHEINMSVAIWVGFLALFGIASDDGVVLITYLQNSLKRRRAPEGQEASLSVADIRAATVEAGRRRIRPMLMTTATTLLALLPVLTSTGRGSDIMIPMAIPVFGGMTIAVLTMFVVPVLYCWTQEIKLRWETRRP